jgi:predicted  nucleic acid-binding Zn-ribbon protein
MDTDVSQELERLRKAIADMDKSHQKELKVHKNAINKVSSKLLTTQRELKAAKDQIRTLRSDLSSLKSSIRRE